MKKVGEQGESRTCGSVCAPPYTETAVQGAAGTGTHPYTEPQRSRDRTVRAQLPHCMTLSRRTYGAYMGKLYAPIGTSGVRALLGNYTRSTGLGDRSR
jgi:hypothetical protein